MIFEIPSSLNSGLSHGEKRFVEFSKFLMKNTNESGIPEVTRILFNEVSDNLNCNFLVCFIGNQVDPIKFLSVQGIRVARFSTWSRHVRSFLSF